MSIRIQQIVSLNGQDGDDICFMYAKDPTAAAQAGIRDPASFTSQADALQQADVWAARFNDRLIACALVRSLAPDQAEVFGISVRPSSRDRQVAARMLRTLLPVIAQDHERITLHVPATPEQGLLPLRIRGLNYVELPDCRLEYRKCG